MGSDTVTNLNPGAGGDPMDESLATQSDGSTQGKRPRVELALGGGGPLVRVGYPLPVGLCDEDRARLDRIAELLEKLVTRAGGVP